MDHSLSTPKDPSFRILPTVKRFSQASQTTAAPSDPTPHPERSEEETSTWATLILASQYPADAKGIATFLGGIPT